MTKNEVSELLTRIKAHYPNFSVDDYVIKEWFKYLKDYQKEDVHRKFEEHLKGEFAQYEPKISFLIKYLKTKDEKNIITEKKFTCKFCEESVKEEEYDKHYERCMRINYIYTKADKHNLNIKSDLYSMKLDEIDEVYYKVIERIKDDVPVLEKMLIKKILETR